MTYFQQWVLGVVLVIVGINILGLWAVQVVHWQRIGDLATEQSQVVQALSDQKSVLPASSPTLVASPSNQIAVTQRLTQDLDQVVSQQSQLNRLIKSIQQTLAEVTDRLTTVEETATSTTDATSQTAVGGSNATVTTTTQANATNVKEQTVYLGSGSSASTNWTDISSAAIELNSVNYAGVKRVVFEATLSIIGGEVSARLKNKTSSNIIYQSQVTHNTSTATQKLSSSFGLDSGSNTYVVQLRSSSGESAILNGARLRFYYE